MLKSYKERISRAVSIRRACKAIPTTPLICVYGGLISVYILISIFLVPDDGPREFNFVDESGSITALSAIFLSTAAAFAFVAFVVGKHQHKTIPWFWLLSSIALGMLALDELLRFHERIGDRIDGMGISAGPVRHWNDIIVVSYGFFALGFLATFLPTILKYPRFIELMVVAFLFYVLHTAIDSLTEPPTETSNILEESAKLFCSGFISLAFLIGAVTATISSKQEE